MSSKKRPNGADAYYDRHLQGTPYRRKPQADEQALYERMHLRTLTELSLNRFKWINVPEEIDKRYIEMVLFHNALGLFARDITYGKYVFTKAAMSGPLDMYENPLAFNTVAFNYPNRYVHTEKESSLMGRGVPIYSNYLRIPDIDIVLLYSQRLAMTDRTVDINLENTRKSKYIISSERQRLSMDNISREMEQGSNNIKVRGSSGPGSMNPLEGIAVMDLAVNPEGVERIHIVRKRLFDEALMYLGIDSANQDKKERLVQDEVKAGEDKTSLVRFVNLQARQEACKKINNIYGLDVWVEYNTEIDKEVALLPGYAEDGLEEEGFELSPDNPMENKEEGVFDERVYDAAERGN